MSLGIWTGVAQLAAGGVAANATVEVRRESDNGLAAICSDRAGTAPIVNPSAFADAYGRIVFYAAGVDQGYSIKVTKDAFTYTLHNQPMGLAREFDAAVFWAGVWAATTAAAARLAQGFPAIVAKGDAWYGSAADTLVKKAAPANGMARMADSSQSDGWLDVPHMYGTKNLLINPDGGIYKRVVVATADDTYFADRWYILSQTSTVTPSVLTNPEDGYARGVRITQSQAAAQRFGFAQIIEGVYCKHLRGQSGVLVPRVRISNSQAIRYAILAWTGTEDAVTSDAVNDWTSGDYTDGAAKFFVDTGYVPLVVGAATPSVLRVR